MVVPGGFSQGLFLGIAMLVQTSPGCRGSQGWYFLVLTGSVTSQAGTQGLTEDWSDESESEEDQSIPLTVALKTGKNWEFPDGLAVRIRHFHCHSPGSSPGQGTEILQAVWHGKKKAGKVSGFPLHVTCIKSLH